MKVTDLTVEELQALIRKVVHEELQEIIKSITRRLAAVAGRRSVKPPILFVKIKRSTWVRSV